MKTNTKKEKEEKLCVGGGGKVDGKEGRKTQGIYRRGHGGREQGR